MATLDLSQIRTKIELMDLLGIFFELPNWWGRNWDAFNDCIQERETSGLPSQIQIIGLEDFRKNLPEDAHILEEILAENNIHYATLPSLDNK